MESHGKPNGHVAAGENLASFQPKDAMTTPWGRGGLHEDQVWTYGFVASLRRPLRSVLRCLATDQALEKLTNKATTEVFFVGSLSSVSGFQNKLKKNCVLRTACSFADFRSGYDWSARTSSLKVGLQSWDVFVESLKLWCPRCPYSTQAAWKPCNTTCFVSTLYRIAPWFVHVVSPAILEDQCVATPESSFFPFLLPVQRMASVWSKAV